MNILYIAYSCSPYYGSEDKIGWNIPLESVKENNVFVITKEEHRKDIEGYLAEHKIDNLSFYFVDTPSIYKKVYKGPIYSGRLNIWHKKSLAIAKTICQKEKIDVIHQITPIEFRSIGNYSSIPNVKFVCGPLGGGEYIPKGLRGYVGGNFVFEWIRSFLNGWFRFKYKYTKRLNHCDYVLFANKETRDYLSDLLDKNKSGLFSEIGILSNEISKKVEQRTDANQKPIFLVACRMIYRKGISFLLDALKALPENLEYSCRIVGSGEELKKLKKKCKKLCLEDKVFFVGKVPYDKMCEEYVRADAFIMPSIRETTGSVLLESATKGIPVITINKYGGAILLDKESALLYDGENKFSFIENLKNAIEYSINNREEVSKRSEKMMAIAEKNTWENKYKYYQYIYEELFKK